MNVEKRTFRPISAEYLSSAVKVLKRASFGGYKLMSGRVRPTELTIQSAVNQNDQSKLIVESMEKKAFSASQFNPQRFSP